jgi:hypothetical protein
MAETGVWLWPRRAAAADWQGNATKSSYWMLNDLETNVGVNFMVAPILAGAAVAWGGFKLVQFVKAAPPEQLLANLEAEHLVQSSLERIGINLDQRITLPLNKAMVIGDLTEFLERCDIESKNRFEKTFDSLDRADRIACVKTLIERDRSGAPKRRIKRPRSDTGSP